jgi:hypothetical protein
MSVSIYGSGQTVVQVVQTVKTNSFTTSAGTTWTDITGLSVSITPANSSNKIKLTAMISTGGGGNNYGRGFRITRNGTAISIGDAGTGTQASTSMSGTLGNGEMVEITIVYLDSPATTSAITYQVQCYRPPSAVTTTNINIPYVADGNSFTGISTITAEEIAYA